MSSVGLKRVLDADFRSNPQYELVVFDRLPPGQQDILRDLTKDPDFYGVLLPRDADRGIKSVCRDTALLFFTLGEPGPLPSYVHTMFGERTNQAIAELVLDGVLEINREGRFVCGAEAYDLIYEQRRRPTATVLTPLPQLTLEALKYAQALDIDETGALSARLYFYNRVPLSPRWWRRFPQSEAVAAYLGIDSGGRNRPLLEEKWSKVDLAPMDGWFQWKSRQRRSLEERTGQTFKLYISPRPEFVREAFDAVVLTLTESAAAPQFKVGNDAAGLLRPDKMVAYFWSFDSLRKTAEELAERLQGVSAHGVPFTAAISGDGLLSWGIDPPPQKGSLAWQERESWRLWVTNRLATALIAAKKTSGGAPEPWQFALERLRLDGVDTETWTPLESFGRAAEAGT